MSSHKKSLFQIFRFPIPKSWQPVLLSCLSALLLILSYPRPAWWALAWVALVPLLIAVEGRPFWQAFRLGYLCGFLFFGGTLYWFIHVTLAGAVALMAYLALYFAIFAAVASRFHQLYRWSELFALAAVWTMLEMIRNKFLSGFGWVSLGHSQYKFLTVIQIADIVGVFGISFLVILVNILLKELWLLARRRKVRWQMVAPAQTAVAVLFVMTLLYGYVRLQNREKQDQIKISVIQGNIPLADFWQPEIWPQILETHLDLTKKALASRPALVIWPEAAFPGLLWESPRSMSRVAELVRNANVPLLFGMIAEENDRYYNAVRLLFPDGIRQIDHYKIHLVPFGEYIPLADRLPLRKILPVFSRQTPSADFSPGRRWTIFPVPGTGIRQFPEYFSVLICFEDTTADLARRFVRAGANFLVNISNDGWFLDTNEPFLHLQAAVFRSVENRRALVRASNVGVSCFVDQHGRIYYSLRNAAGRQTYLSGIATGRVGLSTQKTFYTRFGNAVVWLGCVLLLSLGVIRRKSRGEHVAAR